MTSKFRSHFECDVAEDLNRRRVRWTYEDLTLLYSIPHIYTPDFVVTTDSGRVFVLEAKGYFKPEDRRKILVVKQEHPNMDLRLLFQRASVPIRKGSKTTYGTWADKHGIPWAEGVVPKEWLCPKP